MNKEILSLVQQNISIAGSLDISFIIPTYNEEVCLPETIEKIKKHTPENLSYEIIVADNGSTDNTIQVATLNANRVVNNDAATVGGLRNCAVSVSSGAVLVFLDADVHLTKQWEDNIYDVFHILMNRPLLITGSRCDIPDDPSWVEECWFKSHVLKECNYINSGHLIMRRDLFESQSGFDDKLTTGEDYVFCQNAMLAGVTISNNPSLRVVHVGYPKTLREFFSREVWHGRGDCSSLKAAWSSKVARAAFLLLMLHFVALSSLLYFNSIHFFVLFVLLIVGLCVVAAIKRHDVRKIGDLLQISGLYYLYFVARAYSCVAIIWTHTLTKRQRQM